MRPSARSRLVPETVRSWCALAVGALVGVPAAVVLAVTLGVDEGTAGLAAGMSFGVVVALAYCVLSLVAFARTRGQALRDALERSVPRRRAATLALGGGATAWSVQFAVIALVVGVVLARGVAPADHPVVVVLGVALVLCSWVTVLVSFTLHYARLDAGIGAGRDAPAPDHRGFGFADETRRAFADYVYLAAQVSTTFSTGDVTVLDTTTRRAVTTHAIIAFGFNAVIVALVVAVLVSS